MPSLPSDIRHDDPPVRSMQSEVDPSLSRGESCVLFEQARFAVEIVEPAQFFPPAVFAGHTHTPVRRAVSIPAGERILQRRELLHHLAERGTGSPEAHELRFDAWMKGDVRIPLVGVLPQLVRRPGKVDLLGVNPCRVMFDVLFGRRVPAGEVSLLLDELAPRTLRDQKPLQ